MSDLQRYIASRKRKDLAFSLNYDEGYEEFKAGVILKQIREHAGLTQQELADKTGSKKSAISRLENHTKDIKLSTLAHVAAALGKKLRIEFIDTAST